ncbi:MAG: AI-2E family transporter [Coleofasciculus sp. C1-SOL-03]|jgi:predicted PurR-regulated permease PerM|uniref:AI-2E family transporter n=1 Tax=Coleofasciculus sp. C1-SOL-03 TaxID=3069522 RepID=UPI0032F105CE
MRVSAKTIQTLLTIIAIILAIAALKATSAITIPLAFAFFIAVLVNPLQRWLNRHVPHWLSLVIVMLVLAGVVGLAIGALLLSAEIVEPKAPQYLDRLQQMFQDAMAWAKQRGLPVEQLSSQDSQGQLTNEAIGGLKFLWNGLSLFILMVSLLVLLLLEVGQYREKIERSLASKTSAKVINAVARMSDKLRGYLLIQSFTCVLTGILTGIWCWVLGVDFALVWGLVAFVLNYVPTLGSIVAVIPPTLLVLIFQGIGRGVATLVGLAVIQVILGNFVDPRLQGRTLKLSPFVALLSIVFWGWVWGIPGAVLGIPMTISLIVFSQEFKSTRAIALLFGDTDDPELKKKLK